MVGVQVNQIKVWQLGLFAGYLQSMGADTLVEVGKACQGTLKLLVYFLYLPK